LLPRNSKDDPAIAIATLQSKFAASALTKADDDKKDSTTDFQFRITTVSGLLRQTGTTRRAAFLGSFRVPTDIPIHPTCNPTQILSDDYKTLPGSLGPHYQQALLPVLSKNMKNSANNANSTELHTWFKTAVLNAQHRDAAEGPPCSIHPNFFDNPTVNAIKNLSFATIDHIKSAKDLTDGSLSVYNYIRMNETHAGKTVPTIPAKT
jgi:hypothetical protein